MTTNLLVPFTIHTALQKRFDNDINRELGPATQPSNFPAKDLTPDPVHYAETIDADPDHGDLAVVTPEEGDFYVNAEIMLPKGGTSHVKGNVIGRANDNPILDTRSYVVDFDDGDTTELTANLKAESKYYA
jgi:hypothetical protein